MSAFLGTFGLNTCSLTTQCITRNLDFYIIDREHGTHSLTECNILLNAISTPCEKYIRVSDNDRIEIQRVLELAPDGIMIPQIGSVEEAIRAISYVKYPPEGLRGTSPFTKAFNFNNKDISQKKERLNKTKICLLIEGASGVDSLDDILTETDRAIHLIYFGFYDFCASKGMEPYWTVDVKLQFKSLVEKCRDHDVAVGTIATNSEEIDTLREIGVNYIVYLNDTGIFSNAISSLRL